jgi:hypothetical protein
MWGCLAYQAFLGLLAHTIGLRKARLATFSRLKPGVQRPGQHVEDARERRPQILLIRTQRSRVSPIPVHGIRELARSGPRKRMVCSQCPVATFAA